jgi:hypothetical protein
MKFYMTAGPLLFLIVIAIIFVFGPHHFSRKPVSELPISAGERIKSELVGT